MQSSIVITSIYEPTLAVKSFASLKNYHLIVVGDNKTPKDWKCENVDYYPIDEQKSSSFKLAKVLPENHYCRKMLGYLRAMQLGAEVIIDTDDDNIPEDGWGFPEFGGDFLISDKGQNFINIYKYFTKQHIWPRGLPLNLITDEKAVIDETKLHKEYVKIGVWQGLANGDPDVDAIYRLTVNKLCNFNKKEPVVLDEGTLSPFNSQNTAFTKELFPLLYLPAYVTFRFTDILRSYVAQPIMWLYGYRLGFSNATVTQERNEHNYLKDFESEIPCYLEVDKVMDVVTNSIRKEFSVKDNLYQAYISLNKEGIVVDKEMEVLKGWLENLI